MAFHTINVDSVKKEINVLLEGAPDDLKVKKFVEDFLKEIGKINPSEYGITFKTVNFSVIKQDMLPMLKNCFDLYKQVGLKAVRMHIGGNSVLKMQVGRIARQAGLENVEILD